jgi:predicted  nucleic acid-binding Zn-ribbon protein
MNKTLLPMIGMAAAVSLLVGCGGTSPMVKERVAKSETAVQQAITTVGSSENGAIELQSAKDNLQTAKSQLAAKNEKGAERYAQKAQLDAELAVAKAQSSAARKAADEVLASVETLRKEAARPQ